jgi:DNA (cytosine-5)-methyltransferase 1
VGAEEIPDFDLMAAGFPCQPYSDLTRGAVGLSSEKGKVFFELLRLIAAKRPKIVLLENVAALMTMPRDRPGQDFLLILAHLHSLGYAVTWQVINAAELGYPQSRERLFLLATLPEADACWSSLHQGMRGDLGYAFTNHVMPKFTLPSVVGARSYLADWPRMGSVDHRGVVRGVCVARRPLSGRLGDVLETGVIPEHYFLTPKERERVAYLKGEKRERRLHAESGGEYEYREGVIPFPDPLERPSRTVVRREGQVGRTSHFVRDPLSGRLRRLLPVEVERLFGFPDGFTDGIGLSDGARFRLLGNSVVVPLVHRIAVQIRDRLP